MMIRYELGKGKTSISLVRFKDGEVAIKITRLLHQYPIGSKDIDDNDLLDSVYLIIYNTAGLKILEKVIRIAKSILEGEENE